MRSTGAGQLLFFLMLPLDYEIFKDGRPYI
jgi:hypothetical protein